MARRCCVRSISLLRLAVIGGSFAGAAHGGVVFDNITGAAFPPTSVVIATQWQAEDVFITGGVGQLLQSVELLTRLSSASTVEQFTGTLTVVVMPSETSVSLGTHPGAPLAQVAISRTWDRGQDALLSLAFPDVPLPSTALWVAWSFSSASGTPLFPGVSVPIVRQTTAAAAVGSTTGLLAGSGSASGPWQVQNNLGERNWTLRVNAVPSPCSMIVLAAGGIAAAQRRRR